ncbi:GntR family transcriptional regulator [Microbacterium halophytorum]|uniref:GntR family transcriptional regulator n=1 Tax=Microbacterium halophytorum TaxID=2067568 RepID=UPI000CFB21C1|nr:GntR family transcriptional regulator [Microbacterium halophytorum]
MTETIAASKSERAYAWLGERIASREFGPGYRLVLGDIARELDMSVVPVREAIRRLEAEGVVTYERNVGARVALADPNEYVYAMQTLGVLEGAAMALAAAHIAPDALDEAERLNRRMHGLLERFDPHQFTVLNERFHTTLFEACPNPHILDLVERGWRRLNNLRDSTFAFVPTRASESVEEHTEILRLVRECAPPAEIENAARQHRWRTMNAYLENRHPATSPTTRSTR